VFPRFEATTTEVLAHCAMLLVPRTKQAGRRRAQIQHARDQVKSDLLAPFLCHHCQVWHTYAEGYMVADKRPCLSLHTNKVVHEGKQLSGAQKGAHPGSNKWTTAGAPTHWLWQVKQRTPAAGARKLGTGGQSAVPRQWASPVCQSMRLGSRN